MTTNTENQTTTRVELQENTAAGLQTVTMEVASSVRMTEKQSTSSLEVSRVSPTAVCFLKRYNKFILEVTKCSEPQSVSSVLNLFFPFH